MLSHFFRTPAAKFVSTLLFAGLLTCGASAATAPASGSTEPVATIRSLLKAMQQGDEAAALDIYRSATDPAAHVWAAMVLERIHFRLDAASADAKLCEDDLIDNKPGIALLCGQFRSGDLRLAGKRGEADEVERELVKRFQGHGVDKALADMQSYLAGEGDALTLNYEQPAGDVSIPLKENWSPVFEATANSHAFDLMLDTGATDLVLGTEQAHALGVRLLDQKVPVGGWLSTNIQAQRGLLDELKFGGITLRHVPVTVVPRSIALIGVNLMAPLGALRISHQALVVYGSKSTVPACDTQILAGSNLWGSSLRLFPELLVNDKPQAVQLDTGASRYLLGTKQALDEVTTLHRGKIPFGDIGGSHPSANAESAKVKLTIAGQPIETYFIVLTDSSSPHGITLGAGALRDMDFLIDFNRQHQCFLLHPDLH